MTTTSTDTYDAGHQRYLQDVTEQSPRDLTPAELAAASEAFQRGYRDAAIQRQEDIAAAGGLDAYYDK